MNSIKFLSSLLLFILVSCASIKVDYDYDENVNFSQFKTFAFYKSGTDRIEISDLDKKRILHSIEDHLNSKGLKQDNENPDILINIFTRSHERINVGSFTNPTLGAGAGTWGTGWNPWLMNSNYIAESTSLEGKIYIDFIDSKKKDLIWQGSGSGAFKKNMRKKDQKINDFIGRILASYPPEKEKH